MNRQIFLHIIVIMTTVIFSGCAALLPHSSSVTRSPWKSYKEVVDAYNTVVINKSTVTDIKKVGFNVYSTSNLKVLSFVDIAAATSTLELKDMGRGITQCLKVRDFCSGYIFEPQVAKSDRVGNFWLDILNFKRKTRDSGWKFKATFLIVDSVVVEKYWYGEPLINLEKTIINPLGPFQEIGNIISTPKFTP
jgi:hypothetical protein